MATRKVVKKTEAAEQQSVVEVEKTEKKKYAPKKVELDLNSYVTVRNGFNGILVYKSSRTREKFIWTEFGDEQEMELQELKNAKNSAKGFFANNWFLIDDPDVIEYLGLQRYYQNALSYDEFDAVFSLPVDEMIEKLSKISKGQKRSLTYRAKQLISEGRIDSIKAINALEKVLGVELIER